MEERSRKSKTMPRRHRSKRQTQKEGEASIALLNPLTVPRDTLLLGRVVVLLDFLAAVPTLLAGAELGDDLRVYLISHVNTRGVNQSAIALKLTLRPSNMRPSKTLIAA